MMMPANTRRLPGNSCISLTHCQPIDTPSPLSSSGPPLFQLISEKCEIFCNTVLMSSPGMMIPAPQTAVKMCSSSLTLIYAYSYVLNKSQLDQRSVHWWKRLMHIGLMYTACPSVA